MTLSLLNIQSSGRYTDSFTRQLSALILKTYHDQNENLTIVDRDLAGGIPFVDEAWIGANFTPADDRTEAQIEKLKYSDSLVQELLEADVFVIGIPVYNFGVPAVFKAWIDMVARVGLTFQYGSEGPQGLLKSKKVFLVLSSGGVPIGSASEMASSYAKLALNFLGIEDISIVDASKIDLDMPLSLDTL